MTPTQFLSAAGVLSCMGAIAIVDARKRIIDPLLIVMLVVMSLSWRVAAGEDSAREFALAAASAAAGAAVILVPILLAVWRGRRWPVFPGDAFMLAAFGFLLGPLAFGWALLAGSLFSLLHRIWLQRRRGRPVRAGYCPMAPGMAAGAAVLFLFCNTGLAAAGPAVPATELMPSPGQDLPRHLQTRHISLVIAAPLEFPQLLQRLSRMASVPVAAEDRPARIVGEERSLPPAPPLTLNHTGPLPDLLDRIAERSGFAWSWHRDRILFYRYRDSEQVLPGALPAKPSSADRIKSGSARSAETPASPDGPWIVDPERHGTLRDVLQDWAQRAGWSIVWKPERRFAVTVRAGFDGGFLDAVDGILAAPATRRTLSAVAYRGNRHLVIGDTGAMRP